MPYVCTPILGSILLPNAGGFIGYFAIRKNVKPYYEKLNKPEWSPPTWIYSPLWVGLYSSIGCGSYLVYKSGGGCQGPAKIPLMVYGVNLALNWAYTPIFFGCHNLKLALIDIGLIDVTALATGYLFYKINKTAGYLFIPYVLWMGVATTICYKIFKSNQREIRSE